MKKKSRDRRVLNRKKQAILRIYMQHPIKLQQDLDFYRELDGKDH